MPELISIIFQKVIWQIMGVIVMSETFFSQADEKILDDVLAEFSKLAAIPRPSKHEEQVSNFLKDFFEKRALKVVQDGLKNIVAEIPASSVKYIVGFS